MVSSSTLSFLEQIKKNNTKEWFSENKKKYEEAKKEFQQFVYTIFGDVSEFDEQINNPEEDVYFFRINRDVRFSKDKSPYKTNMAGVISKGGRKSNGASYYVSLDSENLEIGGGIYMPMSQQLNQIRAYISNHVDEFEDIFYNKAIHTQFNGISQEQVLKKVPRGYDPTHKAAEFLKLKSFVVFKQLKSEEALKDTTNTMIAKHFETIMPLIHFLNRAIKV